MMKMTTKQENMKIKVAEMWQDVIKKKKTRLVDSEFRGGTAKHIAHVSCLRCTQYCGYKGKVD